MRKLIIFLLFTLVSCHPPGASIIRSVDINIRFLNSEGENILWMKDAPFSIYDLRLYYYNSDMDYVLRYKGNLDYPYYITSVIDDGLVTIFPLFGEEDGTYIKGGKSTTYLDFGNGDIDTIQVAGTIKTSTQIINKVWYNGIYMGDDALLKGFDIIK